MKLAYSLPALLLMALSTNATGQTVGRIATSPARDVGIAKTKIPPVLQRAFANPYAPLKSCAQIAAGISALNGPLGPDFGSGGSVKKAGLAEVGGQVLADSIIPFRGVVREVSGAAGAQRRLEQAVSAGFARRGYLRGLQSAKGCKR